MRCPTLKELPPPPPDKTGWPWTEESLQLPDTMPDGKPWPKVSIVTPSFNQGQFIEETIRSVLLQGYPNLEYIIIDGGSTDNSVEIIKKYEPWIAYWESKPDRGPAHAINKGFRKTTGIIIGWLNSDDVYTLNAIPKIAHYLASNQNIDVVYGDCLYIDKTGCKIRHYKTADFDPVKLFIEDFIPQPSTFFRQKILKHTSLNEYLSYCFDYDLWLSIPSKFRFKYVPILLSLYRLHSLSKSVAYNALMRREAYFISFNYLKYTKIPLAIKKMLMDIFYWRASVCSWMLSNKKEAKKNFRKITEKKFISHPLLIKDVISIIINIPTARTLSYQQIKKEVGSLKDYYSLVIEDKNRTLQSRLIAQYFLSLAVEKRSIGLTLKAIAIDPFYFMDLVKAKMKSQHESNVSDLYELIKSSSDKSSS